jgi:hypothetical protein
MCRLRALQTQISGLTESRTRNCDEDTEHKSNRIR